MIIMFSISFTFLCNIYAHLGHVKRTLIPMLPKPEIYSLLYLHHTALNFFLYLFYCKNSKIITPDDNNCWIRTLYTKIHHILLSVYIVPHMSTNYRTLLLLRSSNHLTYTFDCWPNIWALMWNCFTHYVLALLWSQQLVLYIIKILLTYLLTYLLAQFLHVCGYLVCRDYFHFGGHQCGFPAFV